MIGKQENKFKMKPTSALVAAMLMFALVTSVKPQPNCLENGCPAEVCRALFPCDTNEIDEVCAVLFTNKGFGLHEFSNRKCYENWKCSMTENVQFCHEAKCHDPQFEWEEKDCLSSEETPSS